MIKTNIKTIDYYRIRELFNNKQVYKPENESVEVYLFEGIVYYWRKGYATRYKSMT